MKLPMSLGIFALAGTLFLPLLSGCSHDRDHDRHTRGDWDSRRVEPAGYRRDRDWRDHNGRDDWRHDRDDWRRNDD